MSSYQKIFNTHFMEMCRDIEYIFEGSWTISKVVNFFELLIKTKPKLIYEYFIKYETIYHEELSKDPFYFYIVHEYSDDLKKEDSSYLLEHIESFKKELSRISETNKDKIRKYLENLIQIVELDKKSKQGEE